VVVSIHKVSLPGSGRAQPKLLAAHCEVAASWHEAVDFHRIDGHTWPRVLAGWSTVVASVVGIESAA
jgi:hypothetical protein